MSLDLERLERHLRQESVPEKAETFAVLGYINTMGLDPWQMCIDHEKITMHCVHGLAVK